MGKATEYHPSVFLVGFHWLWWSWYHNVTLNSVDSRLLLCYSSVFFDSLTIWCAEFCRLMQGAFENYARRAALLHKQKLVTQTSVEQTVVDRSKMRQSMLSNRHMMNKLLSWLWFLSFSLAGWATTTDALLYWLLSPMQKAKLENKKTC